MTQSILGPSNVEEQKEVYAEDAEVMGIQPGYNVEEGKVSHPN